MSTPGSQVLRVTDDTYGDLIDGEGLVLLHFWADWCGPCNGAVEPVLADLAGTYAADLVVAEIDAEEGREAIDSFGIQTLLTTVLLADGEEVARFRGKTPYVTLERAVERYR